MCFVLFKDIGKNNNCIHDNINTLGCTSFEMHYIYRQPVNANLSTLSLCVFPINSVCLKLNCTSGINKGNCLKYSATGMGIV